MRNIDESKRKNIAQIIASGNVGYIILLAHVKDKLIESKNGDSVESIDINLTGKVKSIYASRVDAIGHFYREKNKGFISYNNEYKSYSQKSHERSLSNRNGKSFF